MEKKKIKILVGILSCIAVFVGTVISYQAARTQATYSGLPTVPCIDFTKPLVQNYSLNISIYIKNKKYPLDASIGHDSGNCLRSISTNDNSGTVYIKANNTDPLTLGQFFDTWKRTFTQTQMFAFQTEQPNAIKVFVDSKQVTTLRETILKSSDKIDIIYNE